MPKGISSSVLMFGLAGAVLVGVIGFAVYQKYAPSVYDDFAQCLTDSGAKFYGAYWCPHCANQKKMIGTAMKNVTYVECAVRGQPKSRTPECDAADITGFPTWIMGDGTRLEGEQTFDTLSERSGCELPAEEPAT